MELNFGDGPVDAEPLRVSDFWAAPAWFGELLAFESPVMHYPHHVQRGVSGGHVGAAGVGHPACVLAGIRLPRNVAVHVFAVTLQRAEALT